MLQFIVAYYGGSYVFTLCMCRLFWARLKLVSGHLLEKSCSLG